MAQAGFDQLRLHPQRDAYGSGSRLTSRAGRFLHVGRGAFASMPRMTTPVHAHFSDSWWADSGVDDERHPGGFELWALIVLLALAPGVGVLLTVFLD